MLEDSKRKNNSSGKRLLFLAVLFFVFIGSGIGAVWAFEKKYENKVYPGVFVGDIDLGGRTREELSDIFEEKIEKLEREGINFKYKNNIALISPTVSSVSADMAYQIIFPNPKKTIDTAMEIGRNGNALQKIREKFFNLLRPRFVNFAFDTDNEEIKKILWQNFKDLYVETENASLKPIFEGEKINFELVEESSGVKIDYKKAIDKLNQRLSVLNFDVIELEEEADFPRIKKQDVLNAEAEAQKIINRAPIYLYENLEEGAQTWMIGKKDLALFVELKKNNQGEIFVGLSEDKLKSWLEENISSEIDIKPVNAKFEIKENRVAEFRESQKGKKLNLDKTFEEIENFVLNKSQKEKSVLEIDEVESSLTTEKVNDFGIKEVIGTGHSNFAGSPANRIHNIKTGSSKVDGLLVAPGEEFSLVEALGEVNKESGYLPELVIKGNRTVPEYGGGLCQVATTLFRTAIRAGLEITARRNHSYRVSYYEPAGTDAAVYIPRPDVRFLNDTDNYILIMSRFSGTDMYFDIWGVSDGRKTQIADPVIYNITTPGPTKIVETTELEPGEKKCLEHAHNGADAYFSYKVFYDSGSRIYNKKEITENWDEFYFVEEPSEEIDDEQKKEAGGYLVREKVFYSHYVPWQEVCLVGVEEAAENKQEGGGEGEPSVATSTESAVQ